MVINSPWIMPLLGTKGLASPEQTDLKCLDWLLISPVGDVHDSTKGIKLAKYFLKGSSMLLDLFDVQVQHRDRRMQNYMVLEGVLMKNQDAAFSRDIQLICAEFSSIQVKTQADWMLLQSSYFNPQGFFTTLQGSKIYLEWDPTTADHLEDIMVSPLLQEKSLKLVSIGHISFATHAGWSKFAMHVNEPVISLQGTKHLKSTSKLYLTRRSLEVLKKFHWMILGGRFNQLSHVSSLLLSKPGDY
ncbi:hypothetical protein Tco_0128925 [Tanacetum coccineum]